MDKVIKRIQIDLYSPTCYEVIKAQQGDNGLRVVEFEILNQSEPYILSNVLAKLEGHRGDGSSFIKDCTISENIVSVVLDSDILYDAGNIEAKVVLYDLSSSISTSEIETLSTISTIPFKIYAQKNPCDKNGVLEKQSIADYIMSAFINVQGSMDGAYINFAYIKQILDLLIYNSYIKDDSDGNIYKICSNQGKLYFEKTDDVLTDLLSQIILGSKMIEEEIQSLTFTSQEEAEKYLIYSGYYSGRYPYLAFDDTNRSTYWSPENMANTEGQYIGYKFDIPILLDYAKFSANNHSANASWKIQGSNDGENWDDLTDVIAPTASGISAISYEFSSFNNENFYSQFRVYYASGKQAATYGSGIFDIVFKGHYLKEVGRA